MTNGISIFDQISSEQTMNFSENYPTTFNFFERFFPVTRSSAEYIKVLDYDVDYNPTALAVPDNVIAPLASFPNVDSNIMNFCTFKLEYQLSDSQIRKVLQASTEQEVQDAIKEVFNMEARLIDSQYIARERVRAMALTGKVEINENGFHPSPWDYGLTKENKADIDLLEDDIIKKGLAFNRQILNSKHKKLAQIVLSQEQLTKLTMNEKLRVGVLGTDDGKDRFLTEAEVVNYLQSYLGWEVVKVQDNNGNDYFWTDIDGTENPFLPENNVILLPNINLGATVVAYTAEELTLPQQAGVNVKNTNGIVVISNYQPRPVRFIITCVSRFNVVYPKAPCSIVLNDTSKSIEQVYKELLAG